MKYNKLNIIHSIISRYYQHLDSLLFPLVWLSGEVKKTACEGESIVIDCRGDSMIVVSRAVYGRLSLEVCKRWYENNWSTSCNAKKSLSVVKEQCEGKSSCFLYANTGLFGEPCFGTEKYLEVQYRCKSRNA